MRRDDARLLDLVTPRLVAAVVVPLIVVSFVVNLWLGAAWALLAALLVWFGTRFAAERRAQEDELARLRSADALTGLPNRRVWDDALPRELARSIRTGSPVAIAIFLVDGFEAYSDAHGHQAGDLVLKEMAALWPREMRDSDLLARYRDDQFALLLPDCGSADVQTVVEKVRGTVPPGVTCSAGVATWDGVEGPGALVARAYAALEAARGAGGDAAVVADVPRPAGA